MNEELIGFNHVVVVEGQVVVQCQKCLAVFAVVGEWTGRYGWMEVAVPREVVCPVCKERGGRK